MDTPNDRSTFVTAVAWVFIVLSGFSTLIAVLQNIMLFMMFPVDEMNIAMEEARSSGQVPASAEFMMNNFQYFFLGILLVSLTTLVSSIGLLRRLNWARIIFIVIMILGITWNIGGLALNFVFFSEIPQIDAEGVDETFKIMQTIIIVATTIMTIIFSALFGWIIAKLCSEKIREEFV